MSTTWEWQTLSIARCRVGDDSSYNYLGLALNLGKDSFPFGQKLLKPFSTNHPKISINSVFKYQHICRSQTPQQNASHHRLSNPCCCRSRLCSKQHDSSRSQCRPFQLGRRVLLPQSRHWIPAGTLPWKMVPGRRHCGSIHRSLQVHSG